MVVYDDFDDGRTMDQKLYDENGYVTRAMGDLEVLSGYVVNYDAKIKENGSVECSLEIVSKNNALMNHSFGGNDTKSKHRMAAALDAKIINIGIDFTIVAQLDSDKFTVLRLAEDILRQEFRSIGEISESINLSDIYRLLNQVEGVSDTIDVTMVRKTSPSHSSVDFNVERAMSFDGRYLVPPEDAVFEIRYLDTDIKGTVR